MILDKGHSLDYLQSWKDGTIKQGSRIGNTLLDQHISLKENELGFVLGIPNVGKTHLWMWYALCDSLANGTIWDMCALENRPGISMVRLVQMKAGKYLNKMTQEELYKHHAWIDRHFNFYDHTLVYTHKELLKMFSDSNSTRCFIDPYTGLKRDYGHQGNYNFLNDAFEWKQKNKSLYVSLHTRSEAGGRKYPKGHDFEGFTMPPYPSLCEGGQPFENRADLWITIHRMVAHERLRSTAEVHCQKVKETETGGSVTIMGHPLMLDFNGGLGFTIGGVNPIQEIQQAKLNEQNYKSGNLDFNKINEELDLTDDLPF
jgi:hypothetical protein